MTTSTTVRARRVADLALEGQVGWAALELARFAHPGLEPEPYLDRMTAMAGRVEGSTHLALRRVVGIGEGLGGNVDDYDNPDNSFVNRVLDTRRGIPVSLSVIWMEVGRRAGLEVVGVGIPGHFLVYAARQLVDPFHYGEAIGFDEAAGLVATALGGAPRLDRSWLEPVTDAHTIDRMLRNLDHLYRERGDLHHLEWVTACRDELAR
ncbi:MAG: transglutaminase-like domain-containing protein [Acidimicrobiia bacterium]